MTTITLGRSEYRDKVLACWMGKNIGGTLGGPWECKKHANALTFYDPIPDKSAPNDDLDLQLVWLKMLEEQGLDPSLRTFAEYWNQYACRYPWNEYGFFMRNFSRGLRPPVAGCFENYFVDEMGSPIRSEIWACLHPGDPDAAARMAWKDSAVDHAGGEGMYGEMFWSAVEAAAFVENDPRTLIRIGLNVIPLSSHLARSIREAVWCHDNGLNWGQARERIVARFAGIQPCNAIPNAGFTIIGWLYGNDFGDRMCKAVNCGYDTDCTGATLGSLLGILDGMEGIPEKWTEPVGREIVLHKFTGACDAPRTIDELTDRTVDLAEKVLEGKDGFTFGDETALPENLQSRLHQNRLARESLLQDIHMGVEIADGKEIEFHYGGEPVLYPGVSKEVEIKVDGRADESVELAVPTDWSCERTGAGRFTLYSSGDVADSNRVTVTVANSSVAFTVLGPGEAKGFAAGDNVKTCKACRARVEACMCE